MHREKGNSEVQMVAAPPKLSLLLSQFMQSTREEILKACSVINCIAHLITSIRLHSSGVNLLAASHVITDP
jgi:hypothetical protein